MSQILQKTLSFLEKVLNWIFRKFSPQLAGSLQFSLAALCSFTLLALTLKHFIYKHFICKDSIDDFTCKDSIDRWMFVAGLSLILLSLLNGYLIRFTKLSELSMNKDPEIYQRLFEATFNSTIAIVLFVILFAIGLFDSEPPIAQTLVLLFSVSLLKECFYCHFWIQQRPETEFLQDCPSKNSNP